MAACSRSRALKLLVVFVCAVVLEEYVLGLLLEARPADSPYAANVTRNIQQWPKRTQSRNVTRQCFADGSVPVPTEPFPVGNNMTGSGSPESGPVNQSLENPTINIHNATQRRVFAESVTFVNSDKLTNHSLSASDNTTRNSSSANNTTVQAKASTTHSHSSLYEPPSAASNGSGCHIMCPPVPPGLEGRISVNRTHIPLEVLEDSLLDVAIGGRYAPRDCQPNYKVAIVVPYRNREAHLSVFLNNIHPFLMKQQIDYQIFVVEQDGLSKFNRASLMNVGFVEAMRLREWDCFIFHDVDLLPLDDRNLYTCPSQPRHHSAAIDIYNFKLPYSGIFGGVSALTTEQFRTVNGFSNSFWGWGGEDDDMFNRISYHKYHISRYPMSVAQYTMLSHNKEMPNQERYALLLKGKRLFNTDGLNSLQYRLVHRLERRLYTHLLAALRPPS